MNRWHPNLWILMGSALWVLAGVQPIAAQVVPDSTLPAGERSQVTGNPSFQIDGGARRGGNLFHSFQSFSVPTGGSAYFNSAADVQNIFSRVTGGSISNIDGVIRANGTANLFLLNPNGMIFGPNASLQIGGSFLASTASAIDFADSQFSATTPQASPLLTIAVPTGLQFGQYPGSIDVQGAGYDLSQTSIFSPTTRGSALTGLRVLPGKTLALIGGDVDITGGTLTAERGRIELGSVREGQVSLSGASYLASYQDVRRFGDIRFSQHALADASGSPGGSIQVQGDRVSLTDNSVILIQNQGDERAGRIDVNAAQSLEVSGSYDNLVGGLASETVGGGMGADLAISTKQLVIQNRTSIATNTYSSAQSGSLRVNATDTVQLINGGDLGTAAFSSGTAGDITVSTGRLTGLNGGNIASITFGTGKGGDVAVTAGSIELIGTGPGFTTSQSTAPSSLTALTLGAGDAGKLTVNTAKLVLQNSGAVSTSTLAAGRAGSVTINATDTDISGAAPSQATPSLIGSAGNVVNQDLQTGLRLPPVPSGASGDVTLNTVRLRVADGAAIEVSNAGRGNAGRLQINASFISLDNRGSITAATASGEGGNIQLQVGDLLLLRHNSTISASSGGTGNGGNISIETPLLVAVPKENSDISANARGGSGGRVIIDTQGIFGIEARPQSTPSSDITASSDLGPQFSGTVNVNTPGTDPSRGLVTLIANPVDSSRLIVRGCAADEGDSFVITGRGGLPPNVEQQLDDDADWQDRRRLVVARQTPHPSSHKPNRTYTPKPQPPIVEATGWQRTPTGDIMLVASTPETTEQNRFNQPVCQKQ